MILRRSCVTAVGRKVKQMFNGQTEAPAYDDRIAKIGAGGLMKPRTRLERLYDMKRGLESRLDEVNTAIRLLEDNPKLTEIIDALEKVGG